MNQLFSYIIQLFIVSGLLYGYYHIALRNQRFHAYNRFYILAATLLSFFIPLINIPVYFQSSPLINDWAITINEFQTSEIVKNDKGSVAVQQGMSLEEVIFYVLYTTIAMVFLVKLLLSLNYIRRLTHRYRAERIENIRFVNTNEPGTPFSFFNWLFWDRRIDPFSSQGKQVFRHELFHINQRHSLDILFMELVTLLTWFNPFFHLYKREIKAIHEFLADEYAMKEAGSVTYAELLLIRVLNTKSELVNPFFHNQIKRRLQMILKNETPVKTYFRKIMVLPLVFLSFLLFAFSYRTRLQDSKPSPLLIVKTELPAIQKNADTTSPGAKMPDRLLVVIDGNTRRIITNSVKDSLDKIISPDQIQSVHVLKGEAAINKYGKEWANGVVEITTKKTSLTPIKEEEVTVIGHKRSGEKDTINAEGHRFIADSVIVVTGYKKEKPETDNEVDNKIFTRVEMEAGFPGGNEAFKRFLEAHLNRKTGQNNGAPAGNYTVVIQFVVNLDGTISDIRPLTNFGFGMEQEAIRVLKAGPKWVPAVQNGRNVVAYRKQVINFF